MITTAAGESLILLDRTYQREREFNQGLALTQEYTPKRYQEKTAKLVSETARLNFGLNELEHRR